MIILPWILITSQFTFDCIAQYNDGAKGYQGIRTIETLEYENTRSENHLRTIFFEEYTFFSRNTIPVLMVLYDLIFTLLTFTDKSVKVLAGLLLR